MATEITGQRILRMQDLPAKIGFRPSTIYELIAKGKFPAPFKLVPGGRAAGCLRPPSMSGSRPAENSSKTSNQSKTHGGDRGLTLACNVGVTD